MQFQALRAFLITFATAAALTIPASPALADSGSGSYCWEDIDTGIVRCFDTAVELAVDIAPITSDVVDRSASTRYYTLATWYEDINYGGATYLTRSTNSAYCAGGSYSNDFPTTPVNWNNEVSSFRTSWGCVGTIFDLPGGGGSTYGPTTAAPNVGSMNDRGTSLNVH